jgi:hypothetical protein
VLERREERDASFERYTGRREETWDRSGDGERDDIALVEGA